MKICQSFGKKSLKKMIGNLFKMIKKEINAIERWRKRGKF